MNISGNDCFEDSELHQFVPFFKKGDQMPEDRRSVLTLQDLSANVVAKHLPYSRVRQKYSEVPEDVAKKIMFWSFPRSGRDIVRYCLDHRIRYNGYPECFGVKKITQIGFCVQGIVTAQDEDFNVSLIFDRCVITDVKCSCRENCGLWCSHATVLALYRIRYSNSVEVCMPRFLDIDRLNRDQLQKLLQYSFSDHHEDVGGEIVSSVQKQLPPYRPSVTNSQDVRDFAIFAEVNDSPSWFLDRKIFAKYSSEILRDIFPLMEKIISMVNAKDRNGLEILQCLLEAGIDVSFHLLDDIRLLKSWTFLLAAPHISTEEKQKFCSLISSWPSKQVERARNFSNLYSTKNVLAPFKNFQSRPFEAKSECLYVMPLCAAYVRWDDPRLKRILSNDSTSLQKSAELNTDEELTWREHLPTSCVRVRALHLGGFYEEALRLSVAVCRAIKHQVKRWTETWMKIQPSLDRSDISEELAKDIIGSSNGEWMDYSCITHLVNPLETLLISLTNTPRIMKDSVSTPLGVRQYYQLAVEALIIIFSQQVTSHSSSWEDNAQLHRWMDFVFKALQGKHAGVDSAWVVDNEAIRDLIESLLQSGVFTSCGNFNYFAVLRCDWILSMTRAILNLDTDLGVKFVLACLPKESSRRRIPCVCEEWLPSQQQYPNCELFRFLLTDFPQNIASKVLEIFMGAESIERINDFVINFFAEDEITADCKKLQMKNISILEWFLQKLHSSLHSKREVSGSKVLEIAKHVGFGQVVYLLQNWDKYLRLSESMKIELFLFDSCRKFSKEETAILKNEGYNLVLRIAENKIKIEKQEIVFQFLSKMLQNEKESKRRASNSFNWFPCYPRKKHRYSESLEEEERDVLRRKRFKTGLRCTNSNGGGFI